MDNITCRKKSVDIGLANSGKTLILCDSRGSGLASRLEALGIRPGLVRVKVYKGATYHRALSLAETEITAFQPDVLMFLVGVCHITSRCPRTHICRFAHGSVPEAVRALEDNLYEVVQYAKAVIPTARLVFAPIIGIDLDKYNGGLNAEQDRQTQGLLNHCVLRVNDVIVRLNRAHGSSPPWVERTVHRKRDKNCQVKHRYDRLVDGCHLDDSTKDHWAHSIARSIGFNMALVKPS